MPRGFLAHQLAEVETELTACSFDADTLALEVGEHSDAIHWDQAAPLPADVWMAKVVSLQNKLNRAEGLLRAYSMVASTTKGE